MFSFYTPGLKTNGRNISLPCRSVRKHSRARHYLVAVRDFVLKFIAICFKSVGRVAYKNGCSLFVSFQVMPASIVNYRASVRAITR